MAVTVKTIVRKINIRSSDPETGDVKAHACANAWLRKLSRLVSQMGSRLWTTSELPVSARNTPMPDSIAAMLERRRVQRSSAAICQEPDLLGAISTKVSALLQAVGPATFSTDFSISPTRTVHFRSQMTPCGIPSLQIPRDHRNHFVGRSLYRRWQCYGHRDCLRRATRLCEAILRE